MLHRFVSWAATSREVKRGCSAGWDPQHLHLMPPDPVSGTFTYNQKEPDKTHNWSSLSDKQNTSAAQKTGMFKEKGWNITQKLCNPHSSGWKGHTLDTWCTWACASVSLNFTWHGDRQDFNMEHKRSCLWRRLEIIVWTAGAACGNWWDWVKAWDGGLVMECCGGCGGALSPFVSIGLGVLSQENIGLILSEPTGGRDGGNKGKKILCRQIYRATASRGGYTVCCLRLLKGGKRN